MGVTHNPRSDAVAAISLICTCSYIASSLLFTSPSSSSLRYHVALKLLDTRWSWLNSKYMDEAGWLWKRFIVGVL